MRRDNPFTQSLPRLILLVALIVLFVPLPQVEQTGLGWRAIKLDLKQLFGDAHLMGNLLDQLLHPNVFVREKSTEVVSAKFKGPCENEQPHPVTAGEPGKPTITISRHCGSDGDPLTIEGSGFSPNSKGKLNWARFNDREPLLDFQTDAQGSFKIETKISRQLGRDFEYEAIGENPNGRLIPSEALELTASKMYETIMLALMATLFGVIFAIPLSFFGARNLMLPLRGPGVGLMAAIFIGLHGLGLGLYGGDILNALVHTPQVNLGFVNASALGLISAAVLVAIGALIGFIGGGAGIYYLVRLYQNIFRSIESLIVATLFVVWVGIGPAAGTLALAVNTAAGLGKLCSEAIESIDPGPMEAIKATGANFMQMVSFAVVPQVVPQFIGYILYRWDGNVRFSTVLGFVGGGGIGFILIQWINLLQYRNAAVAVWAITLVVYLMDYTSTKLRERIV